MDWLFNHPDDTGEETHAAETTTSTAGQSSDVTLPGSKETPARYRLFGFVSHKGPSVHSGHYVAHLRKGSEGSWVLFNDEKVVKAEEDGTGGVSRLKELGYLYFFARV